MGGRPSSGPPEDAFVDYGLRENRSLTGGLSVRCVKNDDYVAGQSGRICLNWVFPNGVAP